MAAHRDTILSLPEPNQLPQAPLTGWEKAFARFRKSGAYLWEQLRSLVIREQWHVGIVRAPIHSFLDGRDGKPVEWLPDPERTRFYADPFILKRGDEISILFEDFDQITRKGHISAVVSTDGGRSFTSPVRVLGTPTRDSPHASYPYLFEHHGEIYCLPEMFEANQLVLYRAAEFPWRWEHAATLLEGLPVVDPTIFQHDGSWWLFHTLGGAASNLKLYLASAPELFGPWTPHPANPIKTDFRGARPAGTPFVHEGILYRPAQDSTHTYGGAVVIQRVEKLTSTEYRESEVCRIDPKHHGRFSRGFHTIAASGDLCVVDGKRYVWIPQILPAMLNEKYRAILRRINRN